MERKKASDYPQELLDLFHEYQHGDITPARLPRSRAASSPSAALTVVALFESLKPNYAWAQQVPKDDARIKTEVRDRAVAAGQRQHQGLLREAGERDRQAAGVLVIHENRGLNPYIEDVARRFAVANFIAFAPDGLTSVGGYPGNDEQGAVTFREVNGPKMFEDFVAAANWLKAHRTAPARSARSASASAAAS